MNDLESKLARLPLRSAPAEWRAAILQSANESRPAAPAQEWWRAWLRPSRLALIVAWVVIAALRLSQPVEKSTSQPVSWVAWRAQWQMQQEMLARLLEPAAAPDLHPPHPRGASLFRRPEDLLWV